MRVQTVDTPEEFLGLAQDVLADEARHNLILGIVGTLIRSPEIYPNRQLYIVVDGGRALAAAIRTPPYNLIVADAVVPEALAPLVDLAAQDADLPGAVGNEPTISRFVAEWESSRARTATLDMSQGVFELRQVEALDTPHGAARPGVLDDQALIERWVGEFSAEAQPNETHDLDRMRDDIGRRLDGSGPGAYWIWEREGECVSLSGHGNPTGSGIRVGPVYTPPHSRRKGYATALVAAESQWLLDNGYHFCFLYTDLANPTSNAIYERIGYQRIAESAMYGFEKG